jgi:hypothetical protein
MISMQYYLSACRHEYGFSDLEQWQKRKWFFLNEGWQLLAYFILSIEIYKLLPLNWLTSIFPEHKISLLTQQNQVQLYSLLKFPQPLKPVPDTHTHCLNSEAIPKAILRSLRA